MSRIKELREQPENNINIVDVISLITPNKKTKYIDMILRVMKKTKDLNEYNKEVREFLNSNYNIPKEDLEKIHDFQLAFVFKFLESMFNINDIKDYQKFCEYNERGLIEQNDLGKYNSFEELQTQVGLADLKNMEKELEKQVKRVYENTEWLLIRPLTYESSMKYGSNTKWCTTMQNEYSHFRKYASGILIYIINKVTGLKVAVHKELHDGGDLSFWDQKDKRVDSLDSKLPMEILTIIKKEITENFVSNNSLLDIGELKRENKRYDHVKLKSISPMTESEVASREIDEIYAGEEQPVFSSPGVQVIEEDMSESVGNIPNDVFVNVRG